MSASKGASVVCKVKALTWHAKDLSLNLSHSYFLADKHIPDEPKHNVIIYGFI